MAKVKLTEEEVAQVTSILFSYWGYELYYETQLDIFGGRPDIVAVKNKHWCSVVETKATLSYPVLEQVCRWHMEKDYLSSSEWYDKNKNPARTAVPHFLWVATANSASVKLHDMKRYLLDKFRIGWIDITYKDCASHYCDTQLKRYPDNSVSKYSVEDYGMIRIGAKIYEYRVMAHAKIQEGSRGTGHMIVEKLIPEMKEANAGVTADKANFVTPFKLTLRNTVAAMEEGVGYTSKELLSLLRTSGKDHHYSRDSGYTSSIGKWLLHFDYASATGKYPVRYTKKTKV